MITCKAKSEVLVRKHRQANQALTYEGVTHAHHHAVNIHPLEKINECHMNNTAQK